MRIILGGVGSGKSLVITKEAYAKSLNNRVLVITDNVKVTYQRLQMLAKQNDVSEITIFGASNFSQVMHYLIKNSDKYDCVFADISTVGADTFSEAKLEGFAIGAKLDFTVALQSNVYAISGKVAVYEVVDGKKVETALYDRHDIKAIIEELGATR